MKMPDVNVLVYAHRSDSPHHAAARAWLEELVSGPAPFALSCLVAAGFVRVVTHPRLPGGPTPLPVALMVVESLRISPGCRWIQPAGRHWELVTRLAAATQASGKRFADAQHAALALEHGCTWVTHDADFRAFAGHGVSVEWMKPDGGSLQ